MKVIAINGSLLKGWNTDTLLKKALDRAAGRFCRHCQNIECAHIALPSRARTEAVPAKRCFHTALPESDF